MISLSPNSISVILRLYVTIIGYVILLVLLILLLLVIVYRGIWSFILMDTLNDFTLSILESWGKLLIVRSTSCMKSLSSLFGINNLWLTANYICILITLSKLRILCHLWLWAILTRDISIVLFFIRKASLSS